MSLETDSDSSTTSGSTRKSSICSSTTSGSTRKRCSNTTSGSTRKSSICIVLGIHLTRIPVPMKKMNRKGVSIFNR